MVREVKGQGGSWRVKQNAWDTEGQETLDCGGGGVAGTGYRGGAGPGVPSSCLKSRGSAHFGSTCTKDEGQPWACLCCGTFCDDGTFCALQFGSR